MNRSDAVQSLLKLGEIEHDAPWIDYQALGINKKDLASLLDLLSDPALHKASPDSSEIWAPQHAWRAIGQLADERAINGLLTSFNTLVDDDSAHQELPDVMAMIGPAAQAPLGTFLLDNNNQEFARAIAAQALQNIALKYPDKRDESITLLTQQCARLDTQTPDLNALVVCNLLDLDGVEAIKEIRELYSRKIVDLYAVGDIEDVEIALGLRQQRETPRPDYGKVHSLNRTPPQTPAPQQDSLFDELEHFLQQYGKQDALHNIFELDGFITAIICAPNPIAPNQWITQMWGGESATPELPDKKSADLFMSAVMTFHNQVVRALRQGSFNALFAEYKDEGENHLVVDEWCYGFMRAFPLWKHHEEERTLLEKLLHPIKLFGTDQGQFQLDQMEEPHIAQQKQQIEENVRALFDHFVTQQAPGSTIINQGPKVGRNDPCPCGSGKKFKKCCLH